MRAVTQSQLRAMVAQIEGVAGAVGGAAPRSVIATGWPATDTVLGGGLVGGAVHEWFGEEAALAGEPGRSGDGHPPSALLMHLARRAMTAGQRAGWAVWIGRRCWPHAHGLTGEDGLLGRSLWVDAVDRASRLWAIDLAARCGGVCVVVADGSGLDMASTRRLQLAAEAGGSLVLLGRPAAEAELLSAAMTRWRVTPAVSPTDHPRWEVQLWRCKGGQRGSGREGPRRWLVEGMRSRGQGLVVVPAAPGDRLPASDAPPKRRRA